MAAFHLLDPGGAKPGSPGFLAGVLGRAPPGRGPRIRCPLCRWRPGPSDRWQCACGEVWNTFRTMGVCPRCAHPWTRTMCLACHRWSLHADWYERGRAPGAGE